MFKLLRHFSLTSAFAVVSVTVVLVLLYRQNAVDDLVDIAEHQNVTLAHSFANTVWPRFSSYITSISGLDGDALRARPETAELRKVLKALAAGLPVLKVKIYNLDGLAVFSSDARQIGENKRDNIGFLRAARDGKPASKLARKNRFSAFSGEVVDRVLVESYLPIRRGDGRVEGVFELYTDVTPLMGRIRHSTGRLLIGLLATFGALYAVLFLIVRNADGILRKQYVDLRQAEQALKEANDRLEQRVEERTRTLSREIAERRRVEDKIKDLAKFPEENPDPVLKFATDGTLFYANKASGPLLKELDCAIGEPAPGAWRRTITEVLESGVAREREHRCGDRVFSLLFNPVPESGCVNVYGRDITERKRAEEALRESEERFRTLIDGSSQGILVHRDLRILYVNQSLVEMFGYDSGEEILALESRADLTAPEERDRLLSYHKARLRGETAPVDYEFQGLRKDGSRIWLENRSFRIEWEGGPAICTTLFDISERKRTEEALRESEERFRAVVNNSPTKIHIKDLEGRYTMINHQSELLFGVTEEEAKGRTSRDIFPREVAESFVGHDQRVIETGHTIEAEEEWVQDDGVHTYLTVKFPIRGAAGEIVAVGSIGTDITERKRSEEEIRRLNASLEERVTRRTRDLEDANRELEAFSYSVSHDLRAPLRTIDGFSRILLEEHADSLDDEGRDYLQRVRAGSQKMGQLIDAVLKLSRLSRGEVKRRTLDLSKMAGSIVAELKQSQPDRDLTFKIAPDVTATGDEQLIRVALQNLLGNAVKYTGKRDRATIEFGATNGAGRTVYFVRDNGAGFDMSYADKLFAPFQRAHGAQEFEGMGIGLATVRRIVNRHRGEVWAEAEVDKGATFFFTLSQEG